MDWSEGYVTDIGYVRGHCPALSPLSQSFILANTGFEAPNLEGLFDKIEFGCGYGALLLVEATAHLADTTSRVDGHID